MTIEDDRILASVAGACIDPASAAVRKDPGRREYRPSVQWTLPGFHESARVATSFGDLPIQALRKRDPIRTSHGTLTIVEHVDKIQLDESFLDANPDALPIRIQAGSFGQSRPKQDLIISPHQKVNISAGQYGLDFRLARDLIDRPGVTRHPVSTLCYYTVHCAEPAAVEVEGVCVSIGPKGA